MIRNWSGAALQAEQAWCVRPHQSPLPLGNSCFDILQLQLILGRIDLLGFSPEERLLKRGNQGLRPRILILLRTDYRLQFGNIIGQFIRDSHAYFYTKIGAE